MPPSTPSIGALRCTAHLASSARTQRRSLSSQCLRITSSSQTLRRRTQQRRWQTTEAVVASNPKIQGIVDQISGLTLLETADLVANLKKSLNIPDISFAPPAGSSGASNPAAAAAGGAPAEEEEAAPAAAEKTMFNLKLESFEAASKPKIIKEVKSMLGLSLVDSKKFVESAPKMLKEGVAKEEAEKIRKLLEGLGAKVTMD